MAIVASAVESTIPNVAAAAMRFFLNVEEKMAFDEEREENDEFEGVQTVNYHAHSRKTKVSSCIRRSCACCRMNNDKSVILKCSGVPHVHF